jgi:hypothetical protein
MNPEKRIVTVEGEAFLNFKVYEEGANEYEDSY